MPMAIAKANLADESTVWMIWPLPAELADGYFSSSGIIPRRGGYWW